MNDIARPSGGHNMGPNDRSMVLYGVAYSPLIVLKVGINYLRMKRAARKAEQSFYRELIRSGLPSQDAKGLANEYGSAISLRSLLDSKLLSSFTALQGKR